MLTNEKLMTVDSCVFAWSITGVIGKLEEQGVWLENVEGAGEIPMASRV